MTLHTLAGTATPTPTAPDGTVLPFAMAYGDVVHQADNLSELVAVLIPGYADLDDETAQVARWQCLAGTVNQVQAVSADTHGLDVTAEPEEVLTALFTDRALGFDEGVLPAVWEHKVPLVLLATDFAPYTDTPRVAGNVRYVDPATERTFLQGLSDLGLVRLYTLDETADAR